uniref:Uncharacterized protein n=1 Tax=Ananas comosus var. bracteatus TaxID=296719 RepID=A0A6V7PXF5_ANACO|nr:unnamed protein product [Ananas comosus var. bracteatus]
MYDLFLELSIRLRRQRPRINPNLHHRKSSRRQFESKGAATHEWIQIDANRFSRLASRVTNSMMNAVNICAECVSMADFVFICAIFIRGGDEKYFGRSLAMY